MGGNILLGGQKILCNTIFVNSLLLHAYKVENSSKKNSEYIFYIINKCDVGDRILVVVEEQAVF